MSREGRYSRQVLLPQVGEAGQARLRQARVLIIGMGGLGAPASMYLAGAGIGTLAVCDFDRVALSNLHRQVIYRQDQIGQDKCRAAAETLGALNPDCRIETMAGPLDAAALGAATANADVVLDCTDNFPTRFAINKACVATRTPLVSGAAIRTEGQLAIFDLARGGACYACLFPSSGDEQESCNDAGILGPVVGVVGTRQALAAIKLLLGIENALGTLWIWDALTDASRQLSIARDPDCPICSKSS